jgi:NRAMP (natural resistance-associated macrophage protein)-like metal ion transporter
VRTWHPRRGGAAAARIELTVNHSKAEQSETELHESHSLPGKLWVFVKSLGPGVVTGASDDDPSGIGTYAQTGAQFGYTQLWTALFTFPLQVVIQELCARIALETGDGLAEVIRKHYPKPVLYVCVSLLLVANTITAGADLGAMAASAQLLVGLPFIVWLVVMTLVSAALEIFVDYNRYAKVLRYLTLSLFAYVFVVFVVPQDWGQAFRNTIIPTIQFSKVYWLNLVAVLGTTISPYMFFWQANQEVEEQIDEGKVTEAERKGVTSTELRWMRSDITAGMLFSNVVMWFIIVTSASTLFRNGINNIDSATKAAEALRPLAGDFAYLLFAIGIIGTGLLAVPVLAGSTAYAVAETFHMREGLSLKLKQAPGFYAVIVVSILVGASINFIGINPIQALYYSAVINGIVAPPLLVMIMLIGRNREIMKGETNGPVSNVMGWLTTVLMTAAAAALLMSLFLP